MGNIVDNLFLFDSEKDLIEYKCMWWMWVWYMLMLECLVFIFGYVDKMFVDFEGGFLV